jgi:hypothetical protein
MHLPLLHAWNYLNLRELTQRFGSAAVRSISSAGTLLLATGFLTDHRSSLAQQPPWLESFITKYPETTWTEFVGPVLTRFMCNQHQDLLRRLYHISQTSTVEDYIH